MFHINKDYTRNYVEIHDMAVYLILEKSLIFVK